MEPGLHYVESPGGKIKERGTVVEESYLVKIYGVVGHSGYVAGKTLEIRNRRYKVLSIIRRNDRPFAVNIGSMEAN
jgi:hypothetical protein